MEMRIYLFSKKLLWVAIMVDIAMLSRAAKITSTSEAPQVTTSLEPPGAYAWSSWSSWSPCSRTCGGGVSVQERQCLPRVRESANPQVEDIKAVENTTIPAPVITVRVTREAQLECQGISKRYHECNIAPCPSGEIYTRAEQCAAYDGRPFRGRFYTWLPYIDGDSPCTLNCRPMGQHFYASLSLVADGTPCTLQGSRAICVQGACKAVGGEGVLASVSSRDLHCGRRLVSGLFSRPRLPLGYSYVTTVPRGACRLNITEIKPTENYIALKISNSSYIMNGEFAVSAPGTYEAAGARFLYTRVAGLDAVYAHGPLHHSIDIMILYTEPNPSIKYEYFTESVPGEIDTESATRSDFTDVPSTSASKHFRRHHSYETFSRPTVAKSRQLDVSKELSSAEDNFGENVIGTRKFVWKILSYTQCTRSCGGGIQLGKYRCVEVTPNVGDREIAPVHCFGSAPPARRRRCGASPCPPRWRAAAWSACPRCGPATRTRIVGCVQDHSRGITKINDQKCPAPKPQTTDKCNVPDCTDIGTGIIRQISSKRVLRPREQTDTFREGPVYTIAVNSSDMDVGPEYSFSATAGWLHTDWTECVGWCVGGGVQSRGVRCGDPSGCPSKNTPQNSRTCSPKINCEPIEGHWFTGAWSPCTSDCGGRQIRGVLCIGGTGRHLKDSACKDPKPQNERDCGTECSPKWYYGEWGQCISNCTNGDTVGVQHRTVVCARGGKAATSETDCNGPMPNAKRACDTQCIKTAPSSTFPPDLTIESQKISGYESTAASFTTTTPTILMRDRASRDCEDKLNNCALAVQARLCHYKYYVQNCCHSCFGR